MNFIILFLVCFFNYLFLKVSCYEIESCSVTDDAEVLLFRTSSNNGFHRDVTTEIIIQGLQFAPADSERSNCRIVLRENIPSGMFVDPYQLKRLQQFGIPEFFIIGNQDIEKPEYLSPKTTPVLFFIGLNRTNNAFFAKITIPIHLRYHAPAVSGEEMWADVYLPHPQVFLSCSSIDLKSECLDQIENIPCDQTGNEDCPMILLIYRTPENKLTFKVPVGSQSHFNLVTAFTIIVVCLSCGCLMYLTLKMPNISLTEKKKK